MTELLKLSLDLLQATDEAKKSEIQEAIKAWLNTLRSDDDIRWACQDLASCLFKKQEAETEIEKFNDVIKAEEKKASGWRALSFGADLKIKQKAQQDIADAQSKIDDLDKEIKRLKKVVKAWELNERDRVELEAWKARGCTGDEPNIFAREREELVKGCVKLRLRRANIFIT
jgi:tetratricopeptide (TPR) repeat protein